MPSAVGGPDQPLALIRYAFSSDLVTAGDVVYVAPGRTETVNNTDGSSPISRRHGRWARGRNSHPTITFSTT